MSTAIKYLPTERLGSGPTCDVLLGRDVGGLNRQVAIKRLREETRNQAVRREAFFVAAERWSQLKHEGLVTLFDLNRAEGEVIYEPHPHSGRQLIFSRGLPSQQAQELLARLAQALGYIHEHRYLHLNLKPTNVLFDDAGRPKLIDGLCYDRDHLGDLLIPPGCQEYPAPEMIDTSLGRVGPATDIYGLGFVMLEMILGPTFDEFFRSAGIDPSIASRNWRRWYDALEKSLSQSDQQLPEVPSDLALVVRRMLRTHPQERYQSVTQLLDELPIARGTNQNPSGGSPVESSLDGILRANATQHVTTDSETEPSAKDIPYRPTIGNALAPVVLRYIGCDADMVGVNKDFFTMGDALGCDVVFPAELSREGTVVFRLGRAAEGWRLNCPSGRTFYVNQQVVSASANLRSGDIIRFIPGGPGIQFTIINQNAEPLAKLVARFAPRLVQSDSQENDTLLNGDGDKRRPDKDITPPSRRSRDSSLSSISTDLGEAPSTLQFVFDQGVTCVKRHLASVLLLALVTTWVVIALLARSWLWNQSAIPPTNSTETPAHSAVEVDADAELPPLPEPVPLPPLETP
jgi:serine/threonine protein kinase